MAALEMSMIRKSSNPLFVKAKQERQTASKDFAMTLESVAPHINVMELEEGKKFLEEVATDCLESGSSAFLNRIRNNLDHIESKLELQKYVYNMILFGQGLRIK